MKKALFLVRRPGLYTTFQDLGRKGYQHLGIPVSGAMDPFALQMGNLLVGNHLDEAGIEITMIGPELEVLADHLIAITGADLDVKRNGIPIEIWKSFFVKKGDILTFSRSISGIRAYLTVSGGLESPVYFGSKSTYEKANFGKKVEKGETIYTSRDPYIKRVSGIIKKYVPTYQKDITVRVILGDDFNQLTPESKRIFLSMPYTIGKADRMGFRITSVQPLIHQHGADIISEAVPRGGVQVPANGEPIILMADRQTTGGYRIVATVITADIPKLAQLPPGGIVRFKEISISAAQDLYRNQYRFLKIMQLLMENR